MTRIHSNEGFATHIQPVFLIGTYNEDGSPNFAPITWVTTTWDKDHFQMVINMNGSKKTKDNIARTRLLSANLVSTDMVALLDYFGHASGLEGDKTALSYDHAAGHVLAVPTLTQSRRVYELEVVNTVDTFDTTTYFCKSHNRQQIDTIAPDTSAAEEIRLLDPLVYTGSYYKLGDLIGDMGTFLP